jgi:hypothetical protein
MRDLLRGGEIEAVISPLVDRFDWQAMASKVGKRALLRKAGISGNLL